MRSIHTLMAKFAEIEGATVGSGYKHPTHPAPELEADTKTFFAEHPFLQSYPDYIAYLECYAGAYARPINIKLTVDLLGLTGTSSHLTKEEGVFDSHEFMIFCETLNEPSAGNQTDQLFGFDVTDKRKFGVYRLWTNQLEDA